MLLNVDSLFDRAPVKSHSFLPSIKYGYPTSGILNAYEVLQDLLHVYLPVGRIETLDAAMEPAVRGTDAIIPIEAECVVYARRLADRYPALSARDLLHLAVCQLKKIDHLKTLLPRSHDCLQVSPSLSSDLTHRRPCVRSAPRPCR